ncbi:MAG: hypothetical protein KC443_04560, partial [Anaerolineales bacterium]|nr:hypothetical protein [Anaerolineales bacterium]
ITRFNLKMWANISLDEAWYTHRFSLFEQFCLPSVQRQTNQSFTWLLLFDETTPQYLRSRIESYQKSANIQAHFVNGFDLPAILDIVRKQLPENASYLITTTLDNDDALATTFVDQLQQQFQGQSFELINFTQGLRYDLTSQKLYRCELFSNPFISLIEQIKPGKKFRSIAGCLPHSTITRRFSPLRDVVTTPQWLQLVHERNVEVTQTWGRQRVKRDEMSALFALAYQVPDGWESSINITLQNGRARLERAFINALSDTQKARIRERLHKLRGR